MGLKSYSLVLLIALLGSRGAMVGVANIKLADVLEVGKKVCGIGLTLTRAFANYSKQYKIYDPLNELLRVNDVRVTIIEGAEV